MTITLTVHTKAWLCLKYLKLVVILSLRSSNLYSTAEIYILLVVVKLNMKTACFQRCSVQL